MANTQIMAHMETMVATMDQTMDQTMDIIMDMGVLSFFIVNTYEFVVVTLITASNTKNEMKL
jgi:hypothetical protein